MPTRTLPSTPPERQRFAKEVMTDVRGRRRELERAE